MERHEVFAARQQELFKVAEREGKSPNPYSHANIGVQVGRGPSWMSKFFSGEYTKLDHDVFMALSTVLDIQVE